MRYKVGKVTDFQKKNCNVVEVNGKSIAIYHHEGNFYAILNVCPHKGAGMCTEGLEGTMLPSNPGNYDYGLEGQVVSCPWHGYEFDIKSGKALFGITKQRILTYPVSTENDEIYITMKD